MALPSEKELVRKAIADGKSFQKKHGVAPTIIVKKHHDHLSTLFSPVEATVSGWPMCMTCKTIVEEYGVAHDGSKEVSVYAECHGEKTEHTIRKPYPDVMKVEEYWLTEVMRLLTFFPRGAL